MGKIIMSGKDAKNKMKEGVDSLVDIVKLTMGPAGRNVLLNNVMTQRITKDGVSVAKEIKFENPVIEAGARLVKEAAQKTCDDSGDSTTLCSLLIQKIIDIGSTLLETKSMRPIELKRALDEVCADIVSKLNEMAIPCESDEMLMQVALISANGDEEIAKLVCDAMKQATKDGAVGIETSPTDSSYVETVMGMRFERGYESEYFKNDEATKSCTFDSPNILIYRGKLDNINEFVKILEPSINIGMPFVVMADEFSHDIVNALAMNKVQNGFRLCAVRLPAFKEQRDAMVSDLEILLGCKSINTPQYAIEDFNTDIHLGSCDKITIDKHFTTIAGGDGIEGELHDRINSLREAIEKSDNPDTTARLRERLVKLSGGVSIIYIGSDSETETEEIKDRVDDAVCAVRSAMQEGIIPGGGIAMLSLSETYNGNPIYTLTNRLLKTPFIQLFKNCGFDNSMAMKIAEEAAMRNIGKPAEEMVGYNIRNVSDSRMSVEYMIGSGIIDPKKSIRVALENAVSVAGMFLTTEACVVEDFK